MMAAAYIILAVVSAAYAGAAAWIGAGYRSEGRLDRAIGCGVFGAVALVIAVLCLWEVL